MKDYSQDREQPAILKAFQDKPPGRFLEIGAFHPECFSNTRALYEAGWSGVMIEPSPHCSLNLLDAYGNEPRITLIQAAVSLHPGLVELHITDDAVSTSKESVYEQWKDAAKFRGKLTVPALLLEDIAMRFGGFDFWSIDAEGFSGELFLRMLTLGYFPRCVCVEFDDRLPELCSAATYHSYRLVFSNQTNAIFVK